MRKLRRYLARIASPATVLDLAPAVAPPGADALPRTPQANGSGWGRPPRRPRLVSGARRRRVLLVAGVAVAALATGGGLLAYFTGTSTADSAGAAAAATVNQGSTPIAAVTSGRTVTVSWAATTLSTGAAVDGYYVHRYDASTDVEDTNLLPGCSGLVTATTCTEIGVPFGSWKYAIEPAKGTNWRGALGAASGTVSIGSATLTLDQTLFGPELSQTTTGSISGFAANENVAYDLDGTDGLTGSPTSVDSDGNATITSLEIPNGAFTDGPHTVNAVGDSSPYPSSASAAILIDSTAPTVEASLAPAANGAGWNKTSPVEVTLTADDGANGSGVAKIFYSTDGSPPSIEYTGPISISGDGVHTVAFYAVDEAQNASVVDTQQVKIDTIAPANDVSPLVGSGNALLAGSTLWYRGAAAGSFAISNDLADGGSGPASSATSALSGSTAGWSHDPGSTDVGPPYVSNAFSWDAGTTSSPHEEVTGYDAAGNSTTTGLDFTDDSSGPTGGSVDATGLGGSGGRYSTSTHLSLALDPGTDSGVGLAAAGATLVREHATLSSAGGTADGACSTTWDSPTVIANDPGATVEDDVADGACWRYTYTVADKLGNQATYTSPAIKVDTTAPTTPSNAQITEGTNPGYQYASGGNVFYNPHQSGDFSSASDASDAQSGIKSVTFEKPSGFDVAPNDGVVADPTAGTTYTATYSWSSNEGAASPGALSIGSRNHAGLTAVNAAGLTVTKDGLAPSTSDDSASIGHDWKQTDQTVTLTPSDDTGSGVGHTYATSDGSTPTTSSPDGTSVALTGDGLYTVEYFSVDNVANEEAVQTAATQIRIDKTNPTPGTLGLPAFVRNGHALTSAATDPIVNGASSGVASVEYLYCSGTSCTPDTSIGSSTTGPDYPVTWTSQPGDGEYSVRAKVTDVAGNVAYSTTETTKIDNTKPSTTDDSASIGHDWKKTGQTVTLTPTDPISGGVHSGVARTYYTSDGSTPTTSSPDGTSVALTGDGLYTVKYFSVDNVGNEEDVQTAGTEIRIDETPPAAGSVTLAGSYTNGGTTYIANGQALTDGSAADPTVNGASSGVASVEYFYCSGGGCTPDTSIGSSSNSGSDYSVTWNSQPADGDYRIRATVTDNAGNSPNTAIRDVTIDNTKPTSSASLDPLPNANGWNRANVVVTLDATDARSGVESITYEATGAQPFGPTTVDGDSATLPTITTEGTTTITFHATDNTGNVETDNTKVVKLDKTDPAISASATKAGGGEYTAGTWSNKDVTVHYDCSDPGGSGIDTCTADQVFDTDGTTASTSGTATDNAGNTKDASFGPIKIDKTDPVPGTFTLPSRIASGESLTNDATDATSGVDHVSYYYCAGACDPSPGQDGILIGSSSSSPHYSVTWSSQPSDGTYKVLAQVTDNAANTASSNTQTVAIDNTGPTVTLTNVNGASRSFPYRTNANLSSFGGSCGGGAGDSPTVDWSISGAATQSGTAACSSGSWSKTLPTPLSGEGTYSLSATQADDLGNSGSSGSKSVTIDKTPPTVTLTDVNGSARSFPYRTNASLSSFGGSCSSAGDDSPTINWTISGAATQSGTATCSSGSWSKTLGTPLSGDGTYTLAATQDDDVGNSGSTGDKSVTVDKTAPAVTLTDVNGASRSFPYRTNASLSSFGGACGTASGDNGSVSWSIGGAASQSGTATCSAGSWSHTLGTPLSGEGTYTLSATQDDDVGNSGATGSKSVTIDKTPPTVTLTDVNGSARTFPYRTNANLSSFGGACGTAAGDNGSVSWSISGAATQSGTATCSGGTWSQTLGTALSGEGTYTLSATQSDDAGNSGSASGNHDVTIDKTAPSVTLTQVNGSTVTFPLTLGDGSNVTSFGGSCGTAAGDSSTVSWSVTGDSTQSGTGTCSSGSWSPSALTALGIGRYDLSATQSDGAGNSGSTGSKSVTVAPHVTISSCSVSSSRISCSGTGDTRSTAASTVTVLFCQQNGNPGIGGDCSTAQETDVVSLSGGSWSVTSGTFASGKKFWVQVKQTASPASGTLTSRDVRGPLTT